MSDVDKLQAAEEAAAQRAEEQQRAQHEAEAQELRDEPLRTTATKARRTKALALTQVHPGDNIRPDLPEIQELARSIREVGLLTPLIVRPWNTDADADGSLPRDVDEGVAHYRLIAGHRRHAALVALCEAGVDGFDEVACEIRHDLSEAEAYALMLTENVQRVPLEPVQAARALRLLLDLNEGMSAAALARSLGLRPVWAQTHLKLLELPQEVQDRIEAGDLSVTIADLLRRGQAKGRIDEDRVVELATKAATGEITAAQVKAEAGPPPGSSTVPPKTYRIGPDGKPIIAEQPEARRAAMSPAYGPAEGSAESLPRPTTPMSELPREPIRSATHGLTPAAERESAADASDELTPEEQLDVYLLGRALREWADDDYLDDMGIDRVQAEAYAAALGFEERITEIRRLSHSLMQAEQAMAGAPA